MPNRTILIIDDTPDHLEFLRRLLRAAGYHVLIAPPGADALRQAEHSHADLILLSLTFPGDSAWEQIRHTSEQLAQTRAPILGTSVYAPLLSHAGARAIGLADYVEKPFDIDYLLDRITQLIAPPTALAA